MRLGLILLALPVGLLAQKPITELPYTPSLDIPSMDRSVQPCENFYLYSCGNWIRTNPIPSDQARWDVYSKLTYENQQLLWGLLEQAGKTDASRTPNQQKIGDLFHACMDEAAAEKAGVTPVQGTLDRIAQLKSIGELAAFLGAEQPKLYAASMFFNFGSNQDFEDSSSVIAFAEAGGLGLPDRDYYTKTDAKSEDIRQKYVAHVQRMFQLLGEPETAAAAHAKAVMRIETALAGASLTRVEQRDPYKLLHKMTRTELQALTPTFKWDVYFTALNLPPVRMINVSQPAFYREFEVQLKTSPLDDIKTYLRWHTIHAKARFLSTAFVQADFDFFSKTLRGVPQMQPRWKRCVFPGRPHSGRSPGTGVRREEFHAGHQSANPEDDQGN